MSIDPTKRDEFSSFACAVWLEKVPNPRLVVDMWRCYLQAQKPGFDLRHDPASKLIVALLAHSTEVGIYDPRVPQAALEEIRRERN